MKHILSLLIIACCFAGCKIPQSNRAINKQICEIDELFSDDVARNRELFDQQQMLRWELFGRGVLANRVFLISRVNPTQECVEEINQKLHSQLQKSKCKVGLIQTPDLYIWRAQTTNEPYQVTIWDTPESMPGWEAFIEELNKE